MICKLEAPDKVSSVTSISYSLLIPAADHLHTSNLALLQLFFKKSCRALKYYQKELDDELFRQTFFSSCLP